MTDRPIIFSGPMVRALLEGRKTQTRRLATSPLRLAQAGDRLWVRESGNWQTMTEVAPEPGRQRGAVWYAATGEPSGLSFFGNKQRPSIHMPRWVSRLTLTIERVWQEPLQALSEADAQAEGMGAPYLGDGDPPFEEQSTMISRRMQYRNLWNMLHASKPWDSNPDVLAIAFSVREGNIDGGRPA